MVSVTRSRAFWGFTLGGGGGIAAWLVAEPLMFVIEEQVGRLPLPAPIAELLPVLGFGGIIGLYLGIFIGAVEGILAVNARAYLKGMLVGGLAGLVGGAAGTALGQLLIQTLGGGPLVRAAGWSLFGATLGLAPGAAMGSWDRSRRGFIGGVFGGFGGGLLFGLCHASTGVNVFARVLGLPVLGFVVGLSYALAERLLRTAWVTVLSGKTEGYELVLDTGSVTLGGSSRVDVRLLADPPVPNLAARISHEDGRYRLEKLDIETLKLNDRPVDEAFLKDGDILKIGRIRVLFRQKNLAADHGGGVARPTGSVPTYSTGPQLRTDATARTPSGPRAAQLSMRRTLVGLDGEYSGRKYPLTQDLVRVGRDPENDIVIDEGSISSVHAEIVRKGKWTVLYDRGSTNGTFIKDRRISENALKDGFEIRFGQMRFVYHEDRSE